MSKYYHLYFNMRRNLKFIFTGKRNQATYLIYWPFKIVRYFTQYCSLFSFHVQNSNISACSILTHGKGNKLFFLVVISLSVKKPLWSQCFGFSPDIFVMKYLVQVSPDLERIQKNTNSSFKLIVCKILMLKFWKRFRISYLN